MPRIFDNIKQNLLSTLCETMGLSYRGDFCVGYLNLRGWSKLAGCVDGWESGEDEGTCRVLAGMQDSLEAELRASLSIVLRADELVNSTAIRLTKRLAESPRRRKT